MPNKKLSTSFLPHYESFKKQVNETAEQERARIKTDFEAAPVKLAAKNRELDGIDDRLQAVEDLIESNDLGTNARQLLDEQLGEVAHLLTQNRQEDLNLLAPLGAVQPMKRELDNLLDFQNLRQVCQTIEHQPTDPELKMDQKLGLFNSKFEKNKPIIKQKIKAVLKPNAEDDTEELAETYFEKLKMGYLMRVSLENHHMDDFHQLLTQSAGSKIHSGTSGKVATHLFEPDPSIPTHQGLLGLLECVQSSIQGLIETPEAAVELRTKPRSRSIYDLPSMRLDKPKPNG